jgi:hypothetical protein
MYSYFMDTRQAGRLGAIATNKKLTKEQRSKAAKKAWRTKRQKAAGTPAKKLKAMLKVDGME